MAIMKNRISSLNITVTLVFGLAIGALAIASHAHAQWFEDTYPGFFSLQTPGQLQATAFGGGFVAPLNTASGNPTPAPECAQMVNGALAPQAPGPDNLFLAPGATGSVQVSRRGDLTRYQCCIHPWMRMVVSHDDHEHHH